jgi:hypothetical protein
MSKFDHQLFNGQIWVLPLEIVIYLHDFLEVCLHFDSINAYA